VVGERRLPGAGADHAPGGALNPKPELAVGAVVRRQDRLLLVQRAHDPEAGRWSLPGGRVRFGETMAAAALRELWEETGLRGSCGEVVGWAERISDRYHFVIVDFAVTVDASAPARAASDAAAVAWVALDALPTWPLVHGLWQFLVGAGVVADPDGRSASGGEPASG
jgi:8-oxo-dGTP diphosphatase